MQKPSRAGVLAFSLVVYAAGAAVVSAQSANFEAEKGRLHQQAVKDRAALGIELLDPKLDVLYPYSQITPVPVRKVAPGASAAVALSGTFPPGVAVLSDRDGAVLSGAELSSTEYSARITVGATEGPGYVKLWAITPVHHVWVTMPVLFIDAVYRFDLKSADGYTVLDLTVRMVQAQQRMLEEMMNADPAAAQKKIDQFGCRMVQVDPGPGGAVKGGIVCGKDFAGGGGLQVTGTMTQVR